MKVAVARHANHVSSAARSHLAHAAPDSERGSAASLLRLQRAIGNRATGQLIQLCRDGHT